jgi:hypothetical protein
MAFKRMPGDQKKFQILRMMFDRFGISFKMFPIDELAKLCGQNFNIGLNSENILALKVES